ncbi:MAG: hypothetical protein HY433_00415 [Candidatus Liptonbacteria bacterium]|nr:hypothetical protein [Candidatus Liptonbacteria bacterium]
MRKFKLRTYIFIAVAAIIGVFVYWGSLPAAPGKYDDFAKCIKDSGAIFYGAFWCPRCQSQKAMFGNSARLLPYVECSLPGGSGQTPVCIANGIRGYPAWVFKDGSRLSGEIPFATISEKTGCALPQQ